MRKVCELKVRRYAASMIDINEYLDAFPGSNWSEKLMRRNWKKSFWTVFQTYWSSKLVGRVFIVKMLLLKSVNMFERMEIDETIYESVVEPSYKKILEQILTMMITAGKW